MNKDNDYLDTLQLRSGQAPVLLAQGNFIGVKIKSRWDDVDMSVKKIQLIKFLTPELKQRRERFLQELFAWVRELRGEVGQPRIFSS